MIILGEGTSANVKTNTFLDLKNHARYKKLLDYKSSRQTIAAFHVTMLCAVAYNISCHKETVINETSGYETITSGAWCFFAKRNISLLPVSLSAAAATL